MNPSLIFHLNSELLEGPVFDYKENLLYFLSILDDLVFCYNPSSKEILSVKLDSPVSCIFLVGRKRIIITSKNGYFEVEFNTLQKQFSSQIDIANLVRYNNSIKDPKSSLIYGTVGFPNIKDNIGKAFSYSEVKYKVIIEDTTISNGLAFSQDGLSLYFIDTHTKKLAKYAYDKEVGDVSFESYMIDFNGEGNPDGMCMVNEGMPWTAELGGGGGGGRISRWNPENGQKMIERKLPCPHVTSYCLDKHFKPIYNNCKVFDKDYMYGVGLFYIELN